MSTSGPVKLPETANQRELFSYILRTRDAETKKQLVSLLKPEEQKEFIAFYKEAMAKAQEAQRLRAEVERLQGQREAVLNQYGAQAASQLSQVSVSGSSQPKAPAFRK